MHCRLSRMMAAAITVFVLAITSRSVAQVPTTDTAKPAPAKDSTARAPGDTASARAVAPVPVVNPDPVLANACPVGVLGAADGLLVVTFDAAATPADRAAAAKHIGGTLVARPGSSDNEYYIQVPAGGNAQQLQGVADQLIRLPAVKTVGSAECPTPAPADTSRPR